MEFLRRAANPWGQEVILGIGWDLFWAAVVGGFLFVAVHAFLAMRLRGSEGGGGTATGANLPDRIVRHDLASRLFHWTMAAAMFTLLITAFVPVMGFDFDWVTLHWIGGLALIAAVIYHLVHAIFFQSLRAIWVGPRDIKEGAAELKHLLAGEAGQDAKAGKYPVGNKLYHHGAALATLAAIGTGIFMMYRIDTPVFAQNQYMLSDDSWGLIYLLHGVAGVGLVLMTITHVYMAIRPEKRWQTRSMIKGWITREEYLSHHDPERWDVTGDAGGADAAAPPKHAVGQTT
jgi:cytochrome b subunit of formate dehydrogenase